MHLELMGTEPPHIGEREGFTQASGSRREQRPKLLGVTPQRSQEEPAFPSPAGPAPGVRRPLQLVTAPRTRRAGPAEDPPARGGRSAGSTACRWRSWPAEAPRDLPAEQVGVAATHAHLGRETQSCWLCPRNQEGNRVTRAPPCGVPALSQCLLQRLESP